MSGEAQWSLVRSPYAVLVFGFIEGFVALAVHFPYFHYQRFMFFLSSCTVQCPICSRSSINIYRTVVKTEPARSILSVLDS